MSAAPVLELPRVFVRCDRCGTITSIAHPDAPPGERAPRLHGIAFCDHCPEPCIDLRPIDFTPDIHLDCDGEGCPECRYTGLDQVGARCAECDAPHAHYRSRELATLCDACAGDDNCDGGTGPLLEMRDRLAAQDG